jgi:hypothetical protein
MSQISKVELLELALALGIAPPEACTTRYIFGQCLERARELAAAERRSRPLVVPDLGDCPRRAGKRCTSGGGRFGSSHRCIWCDAPIAPPLYDTRGLRAVGPRGTD